ncbi:hypothetical protein GPECTOR_23g62 [Gonium pectorale]|uniref:Protein kinase domain-containing protein n=1 Tax=Gonium pectorale TaxID=33097 RepID=A0A150GH41_GONPE|nr:hypothetical protein GPECTOR_23g62 [Gonium pectorale]|eukprot:KXZ49134.1 hypothetical protein GPECTOR_23g62 [Gonium pectorale]
MPTTPPANSFLRSPRCVDSEVPLLPIHLPDQPEAYLLQDLLHQLNGSFAQPPDHTSVPPLYDTARGGYAPPPAAHLPSLALIHPLVLGDPAAPPAPSGFQLSLLRRLRNVLEGYIDLKVAETTSPWLGLLLPVATPLAEVGRLLAVVDALLASSPPAPPSEDVLEAAMGRIFMARQEVALLAAGCSGAQHAAERLPPLTPQAIAAESTVLRDPSQPQLLQSRPQGSAVWFVPRADAAPAGAPAFLAASFAPLAPPAVTTANTSSFASFPVSSCSSSSFCSSLSAGPSSSPSRRTSACPHGFVVKVTPCHSPTAYAHLQSGGELPNGKPFDTARLRCVEDAAVEPINAGGLQDASVALHGEGGPFLAPLYVTVRPLAGPPHDQGYDLELVCVYEYVPDGDGVEVATSRVNGILEAASGALQLGAAPLWEVLGSAADAVAATLEELVGRMAAAVARAHALGCVVSDNKPANFLPGARGGLGLLTDSEAVNLCGPRQVLPHSGVHTRDFAAPEQLGLDGGGAWRCQASDVWSLGSSAEALLELAIDRVRQHKLWAVEALLQSPCGPAARLMALRDECMRVRVGERPSAADACAMLGRWAA